MQQAPTTDELLELFVRRSRVPLDEVKRHPHGQLFPDPQPLAAAKDADWPFRLELGARAMLDELAQVALSLDAPAAGAGQVRATGDERGLPLLLVSRREHAVYNSVGHHLPALKRRCPYNPAYVHPDDARRIGAGDGAAVLVESSAGCVRATLQCATDVRAGVVSMAHGFEGAGQGASTAALIDDERDYEPLSGLPRMSAVPVRVRLAD
jgi:anaerobic selenocysteine-containing dehydrogenase